MGIENKRNLLPQLGASLLTYIGEARKPAYRCLEKGKGYVKGVRLLDDELQRVENYLDKTKANRKGMVD